jgi:hypothetical protein
LIYLFLVFILKGLHRKNIVGGSGWRLWLIQGLFARLLHIQISPSIGRQDASEFIVNLNLINHVPILVINNLFALKQIGIEKFLFNSEI